MWHTGRLVFFLMESARITGNEPHIPSANICRDLPLDLSMRQILLTDLSLAVFIDRDLLLKGKY